ncbi:MAG: preprotein translocase subunit SecE [Alphaproteobacteria bacterium]|nr:preprotein translocase subunit SecE [Alphaproteobacteria bacterium]
MSYLIASLKEFKNIRWLSFSRAISLSILVLVVAICAGFFIGLIDKGFKQLVFIITTM